MIIQRLIVGPIQTNCYVIGCEKTKAGAVIDPGGDAGRILDAVKRLGLRIQYVINTHGHFDHTLANAEVVEGTGGQLAIHPDDAPMLEHGGGAFWFGLKSRPSPEPDLLLQDNQTLAVGELEIRVLHTPGHSPGSVSLYVPNENVVFDGDLVFKAGVGRTDLPGGNWQMLVHSIQERLFTLPDNTIIYSGHGPETTVGEEKRSNPWL